MQRNAQCSSLIFKIFCLLQLWIVSLSTDYWIIIDLVPKNKTASALQSHLGIWRGCIIHRSNVSRKIASGSSIQSGDNGETHIFTTSRMLNLCHGGKLLPKKRIYFLARLHRRIQFATQHRINMFFFLHFSAYLFRLIYFKEKKNSH